MIDRIERLTKWAVVLGVFALVAMLLGALPYYSAASEDDPASAQPAIAIEARDGMGDRP